MVSGAVFTTLYFLLNLQMGPISLIVCPWLPFTAQCNVALELIRHICKLQRKYSFVNMAHGTVFTTLHFLFNLQMGTMSLIVCPWLPFTAQCNVALELIRHICKLQRKYSFVNMAHGTVSQHFIFFSTDKWAQ